MLFLLSQSSSHIHTYINSALECDHLNIARCPSSSVMAGREFHRWRWRMRGEALQPGKEKEREQERKGEMEGSKGKGRIKSRFNSCVLPFAPYRYRYFHRNANAAGGDEGVDMDTSKLAHGITNTNAGIDIKSMDFNVDDLEVLWSKMMMRLAKQQYLPRHHRHHRRNTHTLRASANALELHLNQLGRINQLGHFEDGEPAFDYDLSPSLIGPALLATLPRNTPSKTTQEVRELLFEKFKISALHLASSTDLIAYYYGRGTCVSVDLGHSSCRVQPIVQGYSIEHAGTQSRHIGGHVLEQFIAHRLTQVPSVSSMHLTGIHSVSTQSEPSHSYAGTLSRTQEHPIALYSVNSSFSSVAASPASFRMLPLVWCARDVVQRLVYCMPSSHGYDTCIKSIAREKKAEGSTDAADVSRMGADGEKAPKHTGHRKRTYTISSSRLHSSSFSSSPSSSLSLVLGQELCEAGEILFQPRRILNDHDGLVHSLPSLIQTSIMQSPIDHRLELLSNIVLAGGGSLMPGLVARLTRELERMFPEAALARKITVHADPYRGVAAWGGGNLLSCMPSFQDRWEERWEFFERG